MTRYTSSEAPVAEIALEDTFQTWLGSHNSLIETLLNPILGQNPGDAYLNATLGEVEAHTSLTVGSHDHEDTPLLYVLDGEPNAGAVQVVLRNRAPTASGGIGIDLSLIHI